MGTPLFQAISDPSAVKFLNISHIWRASRPTIVSGNSIQIPPLQSRMWAYPKSTFIVGIPNGHAPHVGQGPKTDDNLSRALPTLGGRHIDRPGLEPAHRPRVGVRFQGSNWASRMTEKGESRRLSARANVRFLDGRMRLRTTQLGRNRPSRTEAAPQSGAAERSVQPPQSNRSKPLCRATSSPFAQTHGDSPQCAFVTPPYGCQIRGI